MQDHSLADSPLAAPFLAPRDVQKMPHVDYSLGGDGIGDANSGLESKGWLGRYAGGQFILSAAGALPTTVLTVTGVASFSFCFDVEMRPAIVYEMHAGGSALYWWNPDPGEYQTLELDDATTPRIAMDDTRPAAITNLNAFIVVTYMKGSSLYLRSQQDDFATETLLRAGLTGRVIGQFGVNTLRALQWEMLNTADLVTAAAPPDAPLFEVVDTKQWNEEDAELGPLVYAAVGADYPDFPGATIELSRDGGETWTTVGAVSAEQGAVIGELVAGLADHPDTYPDETNTLSVMLASYGEALETIADELLDAPANLAIVDDELLQFRDVAAVDEDEFDCTYLPRGRFASEAVAHSTGARFVVMTPGVVLAIPLEAEDIGQELHFRAKAIGGEVYTTRTLTFAGNNLTGS